MGRSPGIEEYLNFEQSFFRRYQPQSCRYVTCDKVTSFRSNTETFLWSVVLLKARAYMCNIHGKAFSSLTTKIIFQVISSVRTEIEQYLIITREENNFSLLKKELLHQILIIIKRIYQMQRTVGNCASVIYFMTVGIHGVKFEHDRLNHSQVPWKLRNLCRRILFFLRNSLVAEYSWIEFLGLPSWNSDLCHSHPTIICHLCAFNYKDPALNIVKFYLFNTKYYVKYVNILMELYNALFREFTREIFLKN